ncbi:MAG: molybdopterin molybdotransferase MoeA, partial [Cytophagaceae bacterium]
MISVEQAKELILNNCQASGKSIKINCHKAVGRILATDISAPIDLPPFRQSAVDGYGIKLSDSIKENWKLIDEVRAGEYKEHPVGKNEAVRIFTGARVPDEVDCVIMQEFIDIKDNHLSTSNKELLKHNANIRLKGEQIQKGSIALRKGTILSPAAIGFLNALGIAEVEVVAQPVVGILVTGSELQSPGEPLGKAQIYESNAIMLKAVLQDTLAIEKINIFRVKDDFALTKELIQKTVLDSDLVIITGGVSVGKYDYVRQALEDLGAEDIFFKIAQKPGKPLYFGKLNGIAIFGLPGNPAASLTCYYEYVYPWLIKSLNYTRHHLHKKNLNLSNS